MDVTLPKWGMTMHEATISEWLVAVGDAVTESGAPLLWPLPLRGRRWYPVGSPRALRFRTGGRVEALLVAPALTVATFVLAFLVVPGAAPLLDRLREALGV